ncbi:type II toxin-antitoxin system RatA family toxin [Marinimicrobium alkaliphilum]|uniref:type II toxin-antitoxin system RatA family toxin n=1 Tax=Marinimicrobium alkaliphilum TaxID=2202654 RepID=UPI000DB9E01E|nr:type II toxin-antitoxin system RatA family toxin [Marinimicrobium alkaliphilum]
MTNRIERTALVNYSPQQMFELVNAIETYPEFMEGCRSAEVLARGDDWLEARLELSAAGISQDFITRNRLDPPHQMTMSLVEGPFSLFEGCWSFSELENGCEVGFKLEFALKNRLLGMAVGKVLEVMASHQVDAICARARQVYGVAPAHP